MTPGRETQKLAGGRIDVPMVGRHAESAAVREFGEPSGGGSEPARRRVAPLAPDDRRAALVEATVPLLIENGSAISTRQIAQAAGVNSDRIVLDPGFGFAKETAEENLELMARFSELSRFGLPLLAGTSRKRFLGAVTGREAADRDAATAVTSALLRLQGAAVFRVHNVAINRDALDIADAMLNARQEFERKRPT